MRNQGIALVIIILAAMLGVVLPASAATLNITDYGAVANDSSDDLSAISAAISAAGSGDTVYFPGGTFNISGTVAGKSGVRLEGAAGSVLLYGGSSSGAVLTLHSVSNATVIGLTLDGNLTAQQGIHSWSGSNLLLQNLTVENIRSADGDWTNAGIFFNGAVTDCTITNNTLTDIGTASSYGTGIRLAHGASRNVVEGNTISNTGRGGILCNDDSTDLVIRNNTISGSGLTTEGLGIEMWGRCHRAIIENNTIDHWLSLDSSDYCAVRGNTVSDKSGVWMLCGLEAISQNCVFADNVVDGGAHIGISLSNSNVKQYVIWTHNTINDCGTFAMQLAGESGGCAYQYFYQNKFTNTRAGGLWGGKGDAIRFQGNASYITMEGNEISGNANDGISLFDAGTGPMDYESFTNNTIINNGNGAVWGGFGSNLEWSGNTIYGNHGGVYGDSYNFDLSSSGFSNQKPTAGFDCPSTAQPGQEVSFANTSSDTDGSIAYALWDFGDGIPSTDMNPTHTYTRAGDYVVTLVVWDDEGRGKLTTKSIKVTDALMVTIDQASGQADPTDDTPIHFTAVFNKEVAGFTDGEVTLSGTAGANTSVVVDSGDHMTFDIAVSGMADNGTVIARIPAGVAYSDGIDDSAHQNIASTSTDNRVTYNRYPTVTINQASGQADPTSASPTNFAVVFSKPVSDFAAEDVTLSGTAGADTANVSGSGTTYNVAVSGMTKSGTVIASIAAGVAHDSKGNANKASTSTDNTVTYIYPEVAPINLSLTPSGGTLSTAPMTFTSVYLDKNGYADIKKAYLLISDSLDYSKAVLLFYDVQGNRVYMYSPSSGLGTGYAPGANVTLVSGQCFFYIKDTTVSRSGNELTVNWKVALRSEFLSRNLNGYAYVRDGGGMTDGWDLMGIFHNVKPQVVSIDPNSGVLPIDAKTSLTSIYRDANGSSDLRTCRLFVNDTLGSGNAMFLWYDNATNKVYLKDDANASWGTGYAPGTDVTLSNSQCEVYVKDTTVISAGNDLTLVWSFKLKPSMAEKNLCSWMYANDSGGLFDGWKKMGTYFEPVAPTCVSVTPSSGKVQTSTPLVFTTQYSDDNGHGDIYQCYFQMGQTGSLANNVVVLYDAKAGKVFLRNDANTSWGTGQAPGADVTLENSQCIVYLKDTTVAPSGSTDLIIDWKITLKPGLIGKLLGERMFCRDDGYLSSGWHLKGYVRGQ